MVKTIADRKSLDMFPYFYPKQSGVSSFCMRVKLKVFYNLNFSIHCNKNTLVES